MLKLKLHWQIVIALVLAVLAGSLSGTDTSLFGIRLYDAYAFVGTLFLNALKMLIVPLIASSIVVGIAPEFAVDEVPTVFYILDIIGIVISGIACSSCVASTRNAWR